MSKKIRICKKLSVLFLLIVLLLVMVIKQESILRGLGYFLYTPDAHLKKVDVIVVLRGDEIMGYGRALEAADLYKNGYADFILISTALMDQYTNTLEDIGVDLNTKQENVASILMQLGVDETNIILDDQPAGGGTVGEIKRIGNVMQRKNFTSCIIVTNWFHTRRTKAICSKYMKNKDLHYYITETSHGVSQPDNWWKYRYDALFTLEEFPKLTLFYLRTIFNINFDDDPQ